jgi:hypothetical protein
MINRLVNETFQRFVNDPRGSVYLEGFQPSSFIAEENDKIVAFMHVTPSTITQNGTLTYGYTEGYEVAVKELLDRCITVIKENGGTQLYKWVNTRFGQVRNKEITLWEGLGFTSDEYTQVHVYRGLVDWQEPESFDSAGIEPVQTVSAEDIERMLLEDGEEAMAELFRNQYPPSLTREPNKVILTLRDSGSEAIVGIAFYRVGVTYRGTPNEFLNASAFGIHIRPQYQVSREEIRRFVQGCLVTMKQLDLRNVHTRLTLNHFDVFAAMVTEGFHNTNAERANTIRLTKKL